MMTALEFGNVLALVGSVFIAIFVARGLCLNWIAPNRPPHAASRSHAQPLIGWGIIGASCYVGKKFATMAFVLAIVAVGMGSVLCLMS
ncbi:hypothetical protein D0Z08_21530 [Nocardioides immobilis]|uniref:Uncharacterized protein n=1 Tax=Nocardioides immobilis TaxID=2049295 RepID=A0A417XXH4_9ACTN|nr:hypothetical protein [Nocardioides immobilis]RHW25025.1 hypothetical protein D0Z08_21530 [Nocardioides immobilis]